MMLLLLTTLSEWRKVISNGRILPVGIAFFKTAGTVFALYPIDKMAEELPDPDF